MAIVWTEPTYRQAVAACDTGTETFGSGVQDGLALGNTDGGVTVTVSAASGQTLSGAGSLLAYLYNPTTKLWGRVPEIDLTGFTSGVRTQSWPGLELRGFPPGWRLAYVPDSVTVSSGAVTVQLDAGISIRRQLNAGEAATLAAHVIVDSSALPAGAATSAKQSDGTQKSQVVGATGNVLVIDSSGRPTVNINGTVAVSGTFFQATQPVSAASLPLPTGASTESTLAALSAKLNPLTRDAVETDSGLAVRNIRSHVEQDVTGAESVSMRTPIVSLSFNYSVGNTELYTNTTVTTGAVALVSSMWSGSTGTGAAGSAQIESKKAARYFAGQGVLCSFSAIFTSPTASTQQEAGLGDASNDGYFFGAVGGTFGIIHRVGGSDTLIAQSSWNEDVCNGTGPSGFNLDITKGNIYRIEFLWHGFGPIRFFVSDGSQFIHVHTILWANTQTTPHLGNPNLPFHAKVVNTGNTTNMVLKVASAGIFQEGMAISGFVPLLGIQGSRNNTKTSITTETSVFTLRNRASNVYGGTNTNRGRVKLTSLRFYATSGDATNTFRLVKNTTLGGAPSYTEYDQPTSMAEIDTAGTTLTGGREYYSQRVNNNVQDEIDLTSLNIFLNPGDTITLAAAGNTMTAFMSLSWIEYP